MPQTFDTPLFSSDQSIDRVLKAGLPVMIVFQSTATSPAALDGEMKKIAKENAGKLLVVQLHTKDSPETARRYNVRGTPALVAIKDGQVLSQAENITGGEMERHASYLLGRGPKPEPKVQPQQATAQQPAGVYAGVPPTGTYGTSSQPGYAAGTSAQAGQPVVVTDATFNQEVMRSSVPVVVDFWAPWCGPCRMVAPTLEKLAREWGIRAKVAKMNVDENPLIAGQYGITGIPTMFVVRDGKIVDRWTGALPEPAMRRRLSSVVK